MSRVTPNKGRNRGKSRFCIRGKQGGLMQFQVNLPAVKRRPFTSLTNMVHVWQKVAAAAVASPRSSATLCFCRLLLVWSRVRSITCKTILKSSYTWVQGSVEQADTLVKKHTRHRLRMVSTCLTGTRRGVLLSLQLFDLSSNDSLLTCLCAIQLRRFPSRCGSVLKYRQEPGTRPRVGAAHECLRSSDR